MSECSTRSADREHYGLAVYCAKRFYGRGVPREELIAEAEAALLWAATRFDPARGTRFSTYAIPFVLGALRELCRRAQPMHVPRTDSRVLGAAERMRQDWVAQHGREPTVAELAQAMDMPMERLGEMLAARDRMQSAQDCAALGVHAPVEQGFEDMVLLRESILSLPKPYAQVLWLRHGAGHSQAEVARRLGVSQSQVSRWEHRARELLRDA